MEDMTKLFGVFFGSHCIC